MKRSSLVVIICLIGMVQATAQQHHSLYLPNKGKAGMPIKQVTTLACSGSLTALKIESNPLNAELTGRKEYILQALNDSSYVLPDSITFKGSYAIVSVNDNGLQYLYLGKGSLLQWGKYRIGNNVDSSASLSRNKIGFLYSAGYDLTITLPYDVQQINKGARPWPVLADDKVKDAWMDLKYIINKDSTITATFPAGYNKQMALWYSIIPTHTK